MDKEAHEQEIEKLLKEQEEIRVLVAENRDAYLLHLAQNLNDLSQLYLKMAQLYLDLKQREIAEGLVLKTKKLIEEQQNIIKEIEKTTLMPTL